MRFLVFALFVVVPLLAGCGQGRVKVSGQVLYDGKPLPGGRLTFQPVDPKLNSVPAEIDEQGNYEAMLPAGQVKVAVDNRELEPSTPSSSPLLGIPADAMQKLAKNAKKQTPSPAPEPTPASEEMSRGKLRGKYVPIPDKYYTFEDSDLIFTVDPNNPQHNIELRK